MDLIDEIYKNEGRNGEAMSRSYITNYLDRIVSYDKVEFISENFTRYSWTSNKVLLCSAPELWIDLDVNDWIKIFSFTKRNNRQIKYNDSRDLNNFPDLLFLSVFLEINAVVAYLHIQSISPDQKNSFIDLFTINAPMLFKTDMDLDNFGDGSFAEVEYFERAKEKLLTDGRFKPMPVNYELLRAQLILQKNFL